MTEKVVNRIQIDTMLEKYSIEDANNIKKEIEWIKVNAKTEIVSIELVSKIIFDYFKIKSLIEELGKKDA